MADDATPQRGHFLRGLGALGGKTGIILLACILLIAVSERIDLRLDFSASQSFSVDPELQKIVAGLDAEDGVDIEIIGMWAKSGNGEEPWMADIGPMVERRCKLIARQSERLTWKHIDTELDQPRFEAFAQKYGIAATSNLYVVRSDRDRPFRIPLSSLSPDLLQRELGGALLSLASTQLPVLYCLQGHGELTPQAASTQDSCGAFLRRAELAGYQIALLDDARLERLGQIPTGGVLVVLGPTAPLGLPTLQMIERYHRWRLDAALRR